MYASIKNQLKSKEKITIIVLILTTITLFLASNSLPQHLYL